MLSRSYYLGGDQTCGFSLFLDSKDSLWEKFATSRLQQGGLALGQFTESVTAVDELWEMLQPASVKALNFVPAEEAYRIRRASMRGRARPFICVCCYNFFKINKNYKNVTNVERSAMTANRDDIEVKTGAQSSNNLQGT